MGISLPKFRTSTTKPLGMALTWEEKTCFVLFFLPHNDTQREMQRHFTTVFHCHQICSGNWPIDTSRGSATAPPASHSTLWKPCFKAGSREKQEFLQEALNKELNMLSPGEGQYSASLSTPGSSRVPQAVTLAAAAKPPPFRSSRSCVHTCTPSAFSTRA